MNIGEILKSIREGEGKTLSELSKELKWPVSKLSKIESGNQEITVNELQIICKCLGVDAKDILVNKRRTASIYNMSQGGLTDSFDQVLTKYGFINTKNFAGNELVKVITKEIPVLITKGLNIDIKKFLVKGSGGNGQPAEVPWISIFLRDLTTTATKGLYLVFLIKADLTGMYLSLNQGFTYFKDKYGTKEGKIKIRKAAGEVRNVLNTIPKDSLLDIDLNCVNTLGKGYEAGNIAAKYYSVDNMPSDNELINDIRDYLTSYEELRGIIGNRTIEQFYDYLLLKDDGYEINEEKEIEVIDKTLASVKTNKEQTAGFKGEKKLRKESIIDNKGRKVYPRDPKVAANAIEIAQYNCEVDKNHSSFIRSSNGKNYTESHHLIPLNCQDDFDFSLDVEENICSVCSNCHNCIHYGSDEERVVLLKKLYEERKYHLEEVGLRISFKELKKYYKIDENL